MLQVRAHRWNEVVQGVGVPVPPMLRACRSSTAANDKGLG